MMALMMAAVVQIAVGVAAHDGGWQPAADVPATMGAGGSMTACDGEVYVLPGGGSAQFWSYLPSKNTWRPRATAPYFATTGTAMTSDGAFVWAILGGWLCRYDPNLDDWTQIAPLPEPTGSGACMADDYEAIWIVRGGNSKTGWAWRKSDGAWLPWTLPYIAWHGTAMVRISDTLHLLRGFNSDDRLAYNIPSGIWYFPTPLPATANAGSALAAVGHDLYAFRGASSTAAFKIDSFANTVDVDDAAPQVCKAGTAMTSMNGTLYAAFGASKGFWRRVVWAPAVVADVVPSGPKAEPDERRCGGSAGSKVSPWLLAVLVTLLGLLRPLR